MGFLSCRLGLRGRRERVGLLGWNGMIQRKINPLCRKDCCLRRVVWAEVSGGNLEGVTLVLNFGSLCRLPFAQWIFLSVPFRGKSSTLMAVWAEFSAWNCHVVDGIPWVGYFTSLSWAYISLFCKTDKTYIHNVTAKIKYVKYRAQNRS